MGGDTEIRNAVLHAIHALGISRPHPYDVDCVLGSLMADGMTIVPARSASDGPETKENPA